MSLSDIEISTFIERMEEIGDVWKPEDVKRVYGEMSLEDALAERTSALSAFANIISTVLNRDE